jgi:hypothetical protein
MLYDAMLHGIDARPVSQRRNTNGRQLVLLVAVVSRDGDGGDDVGP